MGRGVQCGVNDVLTMRPDIARLMYNYNSCVSMECALKNNPKNISVSGKSDIYCMCDNGHIFHRIANKMNHLNKDNNGCIICPVCSGSEIQKGVNSLGDLRKDMLAEWDKAKNKTLGIDPFSISPYSNKDVWWKCKNGHSWPASPNSRINKADKNKIYGCKYCDKQAMWRGETDALTVLTRLNRQDVIKEFYLADNGDLRLEDLFYHSTTRYKFKCPICDTIREKTFVNAVSNGCSGCTNQTVTKFNNLRARYPQIADMYDASGANELPSDKIIMGGSKKYGFKCSICGKVYYDTVGHQVGDRGCTECAKALRTSWVEQMLFHGLKYNMSEDSGVNNRYKLFDCVFDIFIDSLDLLIEYDGEYVHSLERNIKKELDYNNVAMEHKLLLIRLKEVETCNLGVKKHYKLYKEKYGYVMHIPVIRKGDFNNVTELCSNCIALLNAMYNLSYSFDLSKIPMREVNKNLVYDKGERSLLFKYPDVVKEYWDYAKNEEVLGLHPKAVFSNSHDYVYMLDKNVGCSYLVRLDTFMTKLKRRGII